MSLTMSGNNDEDFACRASIVKYIYDTRFVSDYKELDVVAQYKQIPKSILSLKNRHNKQTKKENMFYYD